MEKALPALSRRHFAVVRKLSKLLKIASEISLKYLIATFKQNFLPAEKIPQLLELLIYSLLGDP